MIYSIMKKAAIYLIIIYTLLMEGNIPNDNIGSYWIFPVFYPFLNFPVFLKWKYFFVIVKKLVFLIGEQGAKSVITGILEQDWSNKGLQLRWGASLRCGVKLILSGFL